MSKETQSIPEEFVKVVKDLIHDLKSSFPEYTIFIDKWWKEREHFSSIEGDLERENAYKKSQEKSVKLLFDFCKKKLPPRFFDILYQNADIYKEESEIDTEFLPKIHFKNLWQCDITDKTRDTIWKYLQLLLFSVIGTLDNKEAFGDTAKLFEAINEDEFKTKLQETMEQMRGLFHFTEEDENTKTEHENLQPDDLPDVHQINEHISGMLDGKIGKLAREIAEETSSELNMEFTDATSMKDVFNQLLKNPTKLMGLIKNVGTKLDGKLKSGDIKESEMIQEATEIMNQMKNIPGMGNIQGMFSKMGMDMSGLNGAKMNTSAMESKLNQRLKLAKTKERIRAKAEANAKLKEEANAKLFTSTNSTSGTLPTSNLKTDEELIKIFSSGEKVERTPRGSVDSKKKKGKNKRGK
jgi:hypothetical protein